VQRIHHQDAECLGYEDERQAEHHLRKLRKRRPITQAELDRARVCMEVRLCFAKLDQERLARRRTKCENSS
jgi:hypothetical protein